MTKIITINLYLTSKRKIIMRRHYANLGKFTIMEILNKDKTFKEYIVCDIQKEKISNRTFLRASDAINYGYELTESKGLLND